MQHHLPGHKGLAFECGEVAEACDEAKPADFHQGDAVEEDAVRQDEGDVGPAHTGPHSKEPVRQVHQRPVLWEKQKASTCLTAKHIYYDLHNIYLLICISCNAVVAIGDINTCMVNTLLHCKGLLGS